MKIVLLFFALTSGVFGALKSPYEPNIVDLTGIIREEVFPGRPNYDEIAKGDEAEHHWILHLSAPIDVPAKPNDDIDEEELNVTQVQMMLSEVNYKDYLGSIGKIVKVTGTLSHAINGHHHTDILIDVKSIRVMHNHSPEPTGKRAAH